MIDSNEFNAAIQTKLAEAVAEQVANLFKTDEQLLASLRSQAVSLLVRNFNLDVATKAGLSHDVSDKVAELLVTGDNTVLDSTSINNAVSANIAEATGSHVASIIDSDPALLGNIKQQAIAALVRNITLANNVDTIIANKIADQFAEQFGNVSIYNESPNRELSIMEDAVVVENTMTATNVNIVEHLTANDIIISGDLRVTGKVHATGTAWDQLRKSIRDDVANDSSIKSDIVGLVKQQANTINFNEVKLDGVPALKGNTLGTQITESSLTNVGILEGLQVTGDSDIDAIHIENKRVGINTKRPNAALDVWDDEVEVTVGKLRAQTAYIGTNKTQDLVLGVNRNEDITIDTNGLTTIKKLKLGNRLISHGNKIPGYAGNPGDIVLNTGLTVDNPVFAWFCLKGFSWIPLKAAI